MPSNEQSLMEKTISCGFCQTLHIVPFSWAERLLDKYIKRYLNIKKCPHKREKALNILKMLIKMCPGVESYILYYHKPLYSRLGTLYQSIIAPDAAIFLRRAYLHDRTDTLTSEAISCDYCGKESCNFHLVCGGFYFGTCNENECRRRYSICGWCQERVKKGFEKKCVICFKMVMIKPKHTQPADIKKSSVDMIELQELGTPSIYVNSIDGNDIDTDLVINTMKSIP